MIDGHSLWQLTEQACQGMLGLPIVCTEAAQNSFNYAFTAQIKISGAAEALLSLHAEETFARHLASCMYMVDCEELSDEEIHDALGEVVNIVAGNVKGMISGETLLSLPCVGDATEIVSHAPDDNVVEIVGSCEGYGFALYLDSSTMSAIPV